MSPKGVSSRGDPGPISDISNFSHSLIVVTRKDLCVNPLNFITTNVVVVDKRANVAAMLSDDKDVVNTAILYVFYGNSTGLFVCVAVRVAIVELWSKTRRLGIQ